MLRPVISRKACSAWPSTLQLGGRIAPASSLPARSSSNLRLITHSPSAFSASSSVIGATARRFKSSSSTPKRPSPSSSSSSAGSKPATHAKSSSTRNKMGAAAAASKSSARFATPPSATSASFDEMPLFPSHLPAGGAPTRKMGRPTVYHYPRSKSSYGAIRLLEACSLKPIIIDITVDPLLPRDVERFMAELGIDDPRDFMRTSDPLYTELNLHDPALGRDALIQAILDHPQLMRRPVVDLPYREQGQRRRALVVAQPPQRLFSVILNESEEEALGLATPRPLEETEADRWARQWSQAEGQLQIDPEQVAEMRAQLADPDESFDFPEETDEMGEDDELPFAIDDVEEAVSDDIDEAELHRFLREEGLDDEIIIDHTNDHDNDHDEVDDHSREKQPPQQRRRRNDDHSADPEFAAKVNAIILEMARKAVEEEEREPHNANKKTKTKKNVTAEEMTELLERIMEVAPPPPPPPRQRSGRRRLPIPPAPAATSSDSE